MAKQQNSLIVDGHLDLSMNAIEWNRDLRMNTVEINQLEASLSDKPDRGNSTVSFPEMLKGNIRLCIATLISRYAKPDHPLGGCNSPEQAWAMTCAQMAWYDEMKRQKHLVQITSQADLEKHISKLQDSDYQSIGYILSLEGADSIVTFDHLYERHQQGLRAIGPAHYGPGTYAYGTESDAPLSVRGKELLMKMDELNMVLDTTHLCDTAFWEALDIFKGPIWASHSNCRSIVNHNRQFTDEQLRVLIERDAIIGLPFDAWMMVPDWQRGISHPDNTQVTLDDMMNHMDHICQLAGNANHVALGTDLDGGFGTEQCPSDIKTIADLKQIPDLMKERNYSNSDIQKVMSENWLRRLNETLI